MNAGRIIRVGVIGPSKLVQETLAVSRELVGLEALPFAYESAVEAGRLCEEAAGCSEVVMFTGPIGYRMAMREYRPTVPTAYIHYSPMWLYRSLFGVSDRSLLSRVSVDTIDKQVVEATYRELELPLERIEVYRYDGLPDPEQVTDFHVRMAEGNQTRYALTCLLSVYRRLRKLGIPCSWLVPSRVAMRETLERALYLAEGARARGTQIVVGLVKVDLEGRSTTSFEYQKLRLRIHEILLEEMEEIGGHLVDCGGGEYQFFTTRAAFELVTSHYSNWALSDRFFQAGIRAAIGVGFGATANEAGLNARNAVEHASSYETNSCFVMSEDKQLMGPLGPDQIKYELRNTDPRFIALARQLGLAPATLGKVLAICLHLGNQFTAEQLASHLGVTLRSGNRILQRLLREGYVKQVGQESSGGRGRPKRVFQVTERFDAEGGMSRGTDRVEES
ncbi:MAG: hypothetical protein AB1497_11410 [Bacillota bacterium]